MIFPVFKTFLYSKLSMFGFPLVGTTLAVTESFLGNLIIAVVVAVIGATPPTVAIVLMSRKQSDERKAAHLEVINNQAKMKEDLDGKLDRLSKAETGQAKAEGIIEGAAIEREAATHAIPAPDLDKVSKMEIVNQDTNPVPTRAAKPAK